MNRPLVSVIIPFYSNIDWLNKAVISVVQQSYTNLEILIINDGANENFDLLKKLKDKRIEIFNKDNGGPSSARNYGIKNAKGKYIAFLDSDDLWTKNKIELQIEFMEKENYVWSQHSYIMFWNNSERKKIINTSTYSGDVLTSMYISFKVQTSTVMVKRDVLIKHNIFFPLDKRYGQDIYFFRKLASKYELGYINETLSFFRIRGSNAGFKARIQLNFRSESYVEISNNDALIRKLPRGVKLAHKLSYYLNFIVRTVSKINLFNSEGYLENLSRILYLPPYLIIKHYSK